MADSAPSSPNRFVPTYFVARNFSNASAALSRSRIRYFCSLEISARRGLDLLLDPALLGGLLDVHVLDADRAAVRVAQDAEQLAQLHLRHAADAAGEELAVEVPDRQAVRRRVQLDGHLRLGPAQRIEVGDEVATDAVDADQRGDLHLLVQHRVLAGVRVRVGAPVDRGVRHAEALEQPVVEVVLAEQALVHRLEQHAALGALDDPVVVGAGDRDDLADAERAEGALVGALELGRVVDRADADDRPLPGHQPRHALDGADRAGVGQRDRRALEVLHRQLVRLHPADQVLVGGEEAGEVQRVRIADHRRDERALAAALVHVDGEGDVDVLALHQPRAAVVTGDELVVHHRDVVGDGPHDRVADDVGEADLALPGAAAVAVDHLAVDLQQLRRDVAEAGGRRDVEALGHVGGDGQAGPEDQLARVVGGRRSRCRRGCRSRRRRRSDRDRWLVDRCRRGGRDGGAEDVPRLVVLEELLPRLTDRARIVAIALVHLVDEPGVRPEVRARVVGGSHTVDGTCRPVGDVPQRGGASTAFT